MNTKKAIAAFLLALPAFTLVTNNAYCDEDSTGIPKTIKVKISHPIDDGKGDFSGKYQKYITMNYSDLNDANDNSGAIRGFFAKYKNADKEIIKISKSEFETGCVIPYTLGLWLDSDNGLLRVVDTAHMSQNAKEHMAGIFNDSKLNKYSYDLAEGGKNWPIYCPYNQYEFINKKFHGVQGAKFIQTDKEKPQWKPLLKNKSGIWQNQECLYNHIGLMFIPNNYIVPGGMFNEMFGWDSFFMIKGLLDSAQYILDNPDSEIYFAGKGYRKVTANDAVEMFQIAKGMADNHIYEINCYGGFIPNSNRSYHLGRSQPPFLVQESLAVYNFWKNLSDDNKNLFAYRETLGEYLSLEPDAIKKSFKAPTNYEEWLTREVLPAAIAYFKYYTEPNTVYTQWSPYDSSNPKDQKNQHVINGLSVYYVDGIGACFEVVFSPDETNRGLYDMYAANFKNGTFANPQNLYYDPEKGELTEWLYKNDRAVRASGFDISLRFGKAGQFCLDYAPIALNSLLYEMADDIEEISTLDASKDNSYGYTSDEISKNMEFVTTHKTELKKLINSKMWDTGKKYFADYNFYPERNKQSTYAYEFTTKYCPYYVGASDIKIKTKGDLFLPSPAAAKNFGEDVKAVYGVTTSLNKDAIGITQWDFPVAWAPNEYFAYEAMLSCEKNSMADKIAMGWTDTIDMYFAKHGIIIEKYSAYNPLGDVRVTTGYAKNNAGFGWTNGMYMLFIQALNQK
ncbi:MAG TPA: hypothetical protein DD381_03965 [Lentisphaeria bacterium]|nr:MAG: hypothetical protein A2X47_06665 [Lentisphaerae bacterium GWF2_38_69]HBM15486.1 hypothetical protein [Lentisphaeria bacterium]